MRLPPVYPILDVDLVRARGMSELDVARMWLHEGVRFFQLRAKHLPSGAMLEIIDALARDARAVRAPLIVNDRADLAVLGGAAGVHVGQTDLRPSDARRVVGPDAIVGLSTHNDEQVRRAIAEPVDYVAVGPVFDTASKAQPDPVIGLEGVGRARRQLRESGKPLVAIGGITLSTAPAVIAAGASSVAVISDLLKDDPRARIREYLDRLGAPGRVMESEASNPDAGTRNREPGPRT
jgi:thiamine-phosphate pyrophosphorylase